MKTDSRVLTLCYYFIISPVITLFLKTWSVPFRGVPNILNKPIITNTPRKKRDIWGLVRDLVLAILGDINIYHCIISSFNYHDCERER